jgi:hypothetical protein
MFLRSGVALALLVFLSLLHVTDAGMLRGRGVFMSMVQQALLTLGVTLGVAAFARGRRGRGDASAGPALPPCHCLHFDANFLVHDSVLQAATTEPADVAAIVLDVILAVTRRVQPTVLVHVALDGVTAAAKRPQKHQRRVFAAQEHAEV